MREPEMREIAGYPGYFATADGRVFSRWRSGKHKAKGPVFPAHELRPAAGPNGYLGVVLYTEGGSKQTVTVHTLVLRTYGPPKEEGQEVRHLNGDRRDNRIENLAWGTRADNMQDAVRHGRTNRGVKAHNAKLTDETARKIRRDHARGIYLNREIAARHGVSRQTVRDVVSGRTWKHV